MIKQDKFIRKLAIEGKTLQEIANKTDLSITWIRDYLISIKLNDIRIGAKKERKYRTIKEKDRKQITMLAMKEYWPTKIREELKEQYPLKTIISFLKEKDLFIDGRSLWGEQKRHVRKGVLKGVNEGWSINIIAEQEEISRQGVSYQINNYNLSNLWKEKRSARIRLERQLYHLLQLSQDRKYSKSYEEKRMTFSDLEHSIESIRNR